MIREKNDIRKEARKFKKLEKLKIRENDNNFPRVE